MNQFLIRQVLAWLGGINAEQWRTALNYVHYAATTLRGLSGAQRRQWVVAELRKQWPELKNNQLLNLLVEMALAYIRRKNAD